MDNELSLSTEDSTEKLNTNNEKIINILLTDEEFDNVFKEFYNVVSNQYGILIDKILGDRLKSDGSLLTDEEYQRVVEAFDRGKSYRAGRSVKTITCSNGMKVDIVVDVESIIRLNHGKETDSWFD